MVTLVQLVRSTSPMKKVFCLLLVVLAFGISSVASQPCMYSRSEAIKCMMDYVDKNRDDKVAYTELVYFEHTYLSATERALMEGPKDLFTLCDYDNNFLLTQQDFNDTFSTCLVECQDITNFMELVCINAINEFIDRTGHL